jgi:hypothetical protein
LNYLFYAIIKEPITSTDAEWTHQSKNLRKKKNRQQQKKPLNSYLSHLPTSPCFPEVPNSGNASTAAAESQNSSSSTFQRSTLQERKDLKKTRDNERHQSVSVSRKELHHTSDSSRSSIKNPSLSLVENINQPETKTLTKISPQIEPESLVSCSTTTQELAHKGSSETGKCICLSGVENVEMTSHLQLVL